MTETPNSPQISTPEQLEGIVAPGQENLLEEFVQEQEAAQSNNKILGKFNTQEDLEKAYTELEKRVGQQQEKPPAEPPTTNQPDENYTAETASELYGKEYVEALAEKGLDMAKATALKAAAQSLVYFAISESLRLERKARAWGGCGKH